MSESGSFPEHTNGAYPPLTNGEVENLVDWYKSHREIVEEAQIAMRGSEKHFAFIRYLITLGMFDEWNISKPQD